MGAYRCYEQPLLKKRGAAEVVTVNVFAGCLSDDGDSIHSDVTDDFAIALLSGALSRRRRKTLKPRRAAMYGSEVEGVWHGSLDDVKEERPRLESSNTRDPCSTHRSCAASDSKPARSFSKTCKSSSGATRTIKKTSNPACGPCDNCGTSVSPQWRHGSKQKPTVCNACGIRYLRTGCFDRVPADKKRNVSGGPASRTQPDRGVKGERTPTASVDTCQDEDMHDEVTARTMPEHGGGVRSKSPSYDQQIHAASSTTAAVAASLTIDDITEVAPVQVGQQQQQHHVTASAELQPSITVSPYLNPGRSSAYDSATIPQSSPWLCGTSATGSSSAYITSAYGAQAGSSGLPPAAAQQQQMLHRSRAAGQAVSRLGPSPLGRPSQAVASQAGAAAFIASHPFSIAALGQAYFGQARNMQPTVTTLPPSSGPMNTSSARPLVPTNLGTATAVQSEPGPAAVPASAPGATAGTGMSAAALQPELLQLVGMLASRLGSVDAAIAFIKASRTAAAAGGSAHPA